MTQTIEKADGNLWDRLLNRWPLAFDVEDVRTCSVSYGANAEAADRPDWRLRSIDAQCEDKQSQFRNGVIFVRATWPFGLFIMIRWGGPAASPAFLQIGAGWKVNGRIAITLRLQSDASAAAGVTGPNTGQAVGLLPGNH